MLRNIRSAGSLERYYREMLNQCIVLLVSYFASATADIFRAGVVDAVKTGRRRAVLEEEIKISLETLPAVQVGRAGDLLLATSREINLQNVPSIAKTFLKYFNFKRAKDEVVNDIILAHECRHVIVHCGALADEKMWVNLTPLAHGY